MNGALGYFEQAPYQHGTYAIARLFAGRSKGRAFGVAGGGETVQILQKLGIIDDIDLVSTGGGAMLEYLGGKKLPGVKAVTRKL
jgi:phosphoglycerate kinase